MNTNNLKVLVVGCGSIGRRHINNLFTFKVGKILAFDVRDDSRTELESNFNVEWFDDLDDALRQDPDAVLITSPTSLHVQLALQAAKQGCHLFIEKPLSDSMEGVDELLGIVKEKDLVTLVGCNMRFHPGIMQIKKLLGDEAIGHVVSARVEVGQYLPDWHPWADYRQSYSARLDQGGGVILDSIHEIDYIQWMLGKVEEVACFAGKMSNLEIETEDTAAILMRFTSGIIGEVHLDYIQRAYSRTCHIIGDEGTIRWDFSNGKVKCYSTETGEWEMFKNPYGWEANQMYVDEMQHFIRCISMEEKPTMDVFEGAYVLKIALAAKQSAKKREVLKLDRFTL